MKQVELKCPLVHSVDGESTMYVEYIILAKGEAFENLEIYIYVQCHLWVVLELKTT